MEHDLSGPVGIPIQDGVAVDHTAVDATAVDGAQGHDDGLFAQAEDAVDGVLDDIGNALDTIFE